MKEVMNDLRSIIAMKLMALVLWISPHGEKAEFAGFVYKHYGSITFGKEDKE